MNEYLIYITLSLLLTAVSIFVMVRKEKGRQSPNGSLPPFFPFFTRFEAFPDTVLSFGMILFLLGALKLFEEQTPWPFYVLLVLCSLLFYAGGKAIAYGVLRISK